MNENNMKLESGDNKQPEGIVITIEDKEGNPYDATLLTTFQAGNLNRDYCAVLSHVPDADGQYPIQIFRYELTEQDGMEGMNISSVMSDMEFDEAKEILMSLIDEG